MNTITATAIATSFSSKGTVRMSQLQQPPFFTNCSYAADIKINEDLIKKNKELIHVIQQLNMSSVGINNGMVPPVSSVSSVPLMLPSSLLPIPFVFVPAVDIAAPCLPNAYVPSSPASSNHGTYNDTPSICSLSETSASSVSNVSSINNDIDTVPPLSSNFFFDKNILRSTMQQCDQSFDMQEDDYADNNAKLAYGMFRKMAELQVADGEARIQYSINGEAVVLLNIDWTRNYEVMYLVAIPNDQDHIHNWPWKIVNFLSAPEIEHLYGITEFPLSSRFDIRNVHADVLAQYPNLNSYGTDIRLRGRNSVKQMIASRSFGSDNNNDKNNKKKKQCVPSKTSKRKEVQEITREIEITETEFKRRLLTGWMSEAANRVEMVPKWIMKSKKKQWLEWLKFVPMSPNGDEWIGVSLRYLPDNGQWRIECLDYDAGRSFYQHHLLGLDSTHECSKTYKWMKRHITTAYKIIKNN